MFLKHHLVCWSHHPAACVHAHNIHDYENRTVDECKQLCVETDGCVAVEYGVDYGAVQRRVPKDCHLQSSNDSQGCRGVDHNIDLYIKATCQSSDGMFCFIHPVNGYRGR